MREIVTRGDRSAIDILEDELYNGRVVTDDDLRRRARELGIYLAFRDDKRKVTVQNGVLVGEVSESQGGTVKKSRLFASAGEYVLFEIIGPAVRRKGSGTASNFVVLGNQVTKNVARSCIREHWNNGTVRDAIRVIMLTMEKAARTTASVSATFSLVQTPSRSSLSGLTGREPADGLS